MSLAFWTDYLTQAPWALLIVIALFAALESIAIIGLVLPGTVMMTMVASLAGTAGLSVPGVLISGAIGAVIGDGVSYWLGKSQRHRLHRVWPFSKNSSWLDRGQQFFQRYGALSVLLGRFVGPVRPIVPMIAGMLNMPTWRFTLVNVLSAIGWAPLYILPGYYLGHAWQETQALSQDTTMWLIQFVFIAFIALLSFSWLRNLFSRPRIGYRSVLNWARHTRFGRRLWRRSQRVCNSHEPPVAAALLLLISLITFIAWTWIVIAHRDQPLAIDVRSYRLFTELATHHWTQQVAHIIDLMADRIGIGMFMLPWMLWWLYRRYYALVLHWLAAGILLSISVVLIKHGIGRVRPGTADYLAHSFSYPSAHTAVAVVVLGLGAAFVAARLPAAWRNWPYWCATLAAMTVAISRLAYGVHWASDLIGGALLGLTICAAIRSSYPFFAKQRISRARWGWVLALSIVLLALRLAFPTLH